PATQATQATASWLNRFYRLAWFRSSCWPFRNGSFFKCCCSRISLRFCCFSCLLSFFMLGNFFFNIFSFEVFGNLVKDWGILFFCRGRDGSRFSWFSGCSRLFVSFWLDCLSYFCLNWLWLWLCWFYISRFLLCWFLLCRFF